MLDDADRAYAKAKAAIVSNLIKVHDSVDPKIRAISKLWYDGANLIAQKFAKNYNITLEQAAAIEWRLSPPPVLK